MVRQVTIAALLAMVPALLAAQTQGLGAPTFPAPAIAQRDRGASLVTLGSVRALPPKPHSHPSRSA
jgi:hypothetical protein